MRNIQQTKQPSGQHLPSELGARNRPKKTLDNAVKSDQANSESPGTSVKIKRPARGRNSPVIGTNGVHTLPGDNSKIAATLLQILQWGEVDKSNVKELEMRFARFLEYCIKHDVRITNQLTYLALGISAENARDWTAGGYRTREHSLFIKKVKHFCATYREQLGADGKLNPVTLIWWQKNYDGMVDKTEVVLTPNSPLGELKDPTDIQRRLAAAVVIDPDALEGT